MSGRPHSRLIHSFVGHSSFEGRSARRYAFLSRWPLRGVYRRIGEDIALSAPPSAAVLDVGTGPGVLLAEIAAQRPDVTVTGIDPSADMVAQANRSIGSYRDRASARLGDVAGIDFADASFDLIVTTFSMHHWPDLAAAVPELARVLRPGGAVHVYDFADAPFDTLDDAAGRAGLRPSRHGVIHTGRPHLRRCVRHVLVNEPAPVPGPR